MMPKTTKRMLAKKGRGCPAMSKKQASNGGVKDEEEDVETEETKETEAAEKLMMVQRSLVAMDFNAGNKFYILLQANGQTVLFESSVALLDYMACHPNDCEFLAFDSIEEACNKQMDLNCLKVSVCCIVITIIIIFLITNIIIHYCFLVNR